MKNKSPKYPSVTKERRFTQENLDMGKQQNG